MTDDTAHPGIQMQHRQLGTSGLTVSIVGLGCNNFGRKLDRETSAAVVHAALDEGITLFDTSDSYGDPPGASEEFLGAALGKHRADVIVATKFGSDMRGANGPDWGARGSRRYIERAVETSLRRLGTDYIDLYQYHFPDGITPIDETLDALDGLVTSGLVRYIGSSNLAAWQVVEAEHTARASGGTRFISAQNRYSLLERAAEDELMPACRAYGIGLLPYFPLANGLLTGKYSPDEAPAPDTKLANRPAVYAGANWPLIGALRSYAAERGRSLLDVAIAGLAARRPVASVIAGATKPEQVRANAAAGRWTPTPDDLRALDELLTESG